MAKTTKITCDACRREKGQETGWWGIWISMSFRQEQWIDGPGHPIYDLDACSDGCATKLYQRWMQKQREGECQKHAT